MADSSRTEAISVIYPTCGRPEFLSRSVHALLAGEVLPQEIVVVDQSRKDDTRLAMQAIGDSRILHVPSDERGLSRARNLGLRSSHCPVVAYLDDDCVPAPDWLAQAAALLREWPRSVALVGLVGYDDRIFAKPAVPSTLSFDGIYDPWHRDPTGGNSFFLRSVFTAVGEFDPLLGQGSTFPGAEDGDMLYRILRRRLQVVYSDRVRCLHIPWRTDLQKLDNRYNYGSGVGAMLAKHAKRGELTRIATIFAKHFLKKPLLVPWYRVFGPEIEYRRNLTYTRGLYDGFFGWRRIRGTEAGETDEAVREPGERVRSEADHDLG